MPQYTIKLANKAEKYLDKLSDTLANPLLDAIEALSYNPRPIGYIKLKDRNSYRIRVGNYRIIYNIIDTILVIEVIAIGHRKDIYD